MFSSIATKERYKRNCTPPHHITLEAYEEDKNKDLKLMEMELKLEQLEEQNRQLLARNDFLESQVLKLTRTQQSMHKLLSSFIDKKGMEDALKLPLTIGIYCTVKNNYTRVIEKYLKDKFGDRIEEYNTSNNYDLVLVIVYRSSGSLDKIINNRDIESFKNINNCYFVCAHGSVWDDRCNYEELITKFNIKNVLQFNVWDNQIQTRCSPQSISAMKQVDEWCSTSDTTQRTLSDIIGWNLLKTKLPVASHHRTSSV
jgi:DNA-binding Lrp family transcriptional regulator